MKAKLYLKVISVVLVLALVLQSIPIVISAETGPETTEATSTVETDVPYVIGEVSVESEGKKITFKLLDSKKVKTKVKENKHKTEKIGSNIFIRIFTKLML